MNALRVQIYYGEVISKIALYLLPRTMRKRERSRFIFVTHIGIDIFESSSNNSPWSKLIPFFLLDPSFLRIETILLFLADPNDFAKEEGRERSHPEGKNRVKNGKLRIGFP